MAGAAGQVLAQGATGPSFTTTIGNTSEVFTITGSEIAINRGAAEVFGTDLNDTDVSGPVGGTVRLRQGTTTRLTVGNAIIPFVSALQWNSTTALPRITQDIRSAANITGQLFEISAQSVGGSGDIVGGELFLHGGNTSADVGATSETGGLLRLRGGSETGQAATRTGGNVEISGGAGNTSYGSVKILHIATTRIEVGPTGIGFFGQAQTAQPADLGAFVDSTTGTPSGTRTLVDVGVANINNNFATLAAWLTGGATNLRTNVLRALGLTA